jgi:hypothetical protein
MLLTILFTIASKITISEDYYAVLCLAIGFLTMFITNLLSIDKAIKLIRFDLIFFIRDLPRFSRSLSNLLLMVFLNVIFYEFQYIKHIKVTSSFDIDKNE